MKRKDMLGFISFLLLVPYFCSQSLFAATIDPATLKKMSKFQVTRQLIRAKKLGSDQELITQLKERLAQMPDDPPPKPLDAGEGRYYWLPRHSEGTGDWIWQDKDGGSRVVTQTLVSPSEATITKPTIDMPTEPPKAARGPGKWVWRPEKEGEGQAVWIPEDVQEKPIAGPKTSGAEGIADAVQGPEAVVQEKIIEEEKEEEPSGDPSDGPPPTPTDSAPPVPDSGDGPPSTDQPTIPTKPALPKKLTIKERVLKDRPMLTEQEMNSLSQAQKNASDKIFIDAISKIAHEVYVKTEKDQKTEAQVGRKKKIFDTPFEAYRWFILETLIQDVGMNNAFKKREELLELIGEKEDEPGRIFEYIDRVLKKPEDRSLDAFLKHISKRVDRYVGELGLLLVRSVFTISKFKQKAEVNVETLIVNIAISQRSLVSTKKIKIRGEYRDVDDPTPVQKVLNKARVFRFIFDYVNQLVDVATHAQFVPPYRDSNGNLMIEVLRKKLNRLRLDPEFFKFGVLSGSKLREAAAGKGGLDAIKQTPLIDVLDLYDKKYISFFVQPFNIIFAMMHQLFFEYGVGEDMFKKFINKNAKFLKENLEEAKKKGWTEGEIETVIGQTEIYKQAVEDYSDRLKSIIAERKEAIDPYETINSPLQEALLIEQIKKALLALKSIGGTRERNVFINAIVKELDAPKMRFKPNADFIIAELKKLTKKTKLEFEDNVRTVVKRFVGKNENAAVVIDILEQGVKAEEVPLVLWMIQQFEKRKVPIKRYEKALKGITRTPKSVYETLGSLAKRTYVSKVIKDKDFYKLVKPYGLLMIILEKWIEQAGNQPSTKALEALYKTLDLLNSKNAFMPKGEAELYVKDLGDYTDIIYARAYTGKLDAFIEALKGNKLSDVRAEIEKLIVDANTGAEKTAEFDDAIKKFQRAFALTSLKEIIDFLQKLNSGQAEVTIPGINLDLYVHIYIKMKDLLNPLLALLTDDNGNIIEPEKIESSRISGAVSDFLTKAKKVIGRHVELKKDVNNKERTRVTVALSKHMLLLAKKIVQLKKEVPKEVAQPTGPVFPPGGGPPPAPTEGPPAPGSSPPPVPSGGPPPPST